MDVSGHHYCFNKLTFNGLRTLIITERSLLLCHIMSPNAGSEIPSILPFCSRSEGRGLPLLCALGGALSNHPPRFPLLFQVLLTYPTKSRNLILFYGSSDELDFLEAFKSWHFFPLICLHSVQRAHKRAQRNFEMSIPVLRILSDKLELWVEK